MREFTIFALILLCLLPAAAQTVPANWQIIKASGNTCQIAVPPEWTHLGSPGAAVFQDPGMALAVVTSQPSQAFKPLTEMMQKMLDIRKMFENSDKRIFYQDKVSAGAQDPNGYSAAVPAKDGTCSCRVTFVPAVPEETARKIVMSLGAAAADTATAKN